jgi:hypothetical protein
MYYGASMTFVGPHVPFQILVCAGRLSVDLHPGSLSHHLCYHVDF